jgi:hypothetical protein
MAWRAFAWVGLSALLVLLAGCADRPEQTATADAGARARTNCVALRPPPPFASSRSQTLPARTDLTVRC